MTKYDSSIETIVSVDCSYAYTGIYTDSETGEVFYPDSAAAPKLTDGVTGTQSDVSSSSDIWVGMNLFGENVSYFEDTNAVILDLGSKKDKLSKFRVYALDYEDGIVIPDFVRVYLSDDNQWFTYIGTAKSEKAVNAPSGEQEYGIYSFTLSLETAYSARYVKFECAHNEEWLFISEAEVYRNPDLPDTPVINYSLLSYAAADWKSGPEQGGETASVSASKNAVTISGSKSSSPYVYCTVSSPTVLIEDYSLVYDFTVSEGETNIVLYCEGSTAESGSDMIADITHLIAPEGSAQRPSGDNLKAGAYSGKIKLSDLNYSNVNLKEPGKLTISSVKIFSVNGGKITFKKLRLEENIPELNDIGYDAQGIGYYINKYDKDAFIVTTASPLTGHIILPEKVQRDGTTYPVIGIGSQAFKNCEDITEVTVPEGYTSIGSEAFYYCPSLEKVNLPASLHTLYGNPFYMCDVSEINIDSSNINFTVENNVIFNKSKTALFVYPSGKPESDYTIPDGVTTIGSYAFYFAVNLEKINIPNSVTYIAEGAFSKSSITSVSIPDGVDSINYGTFSLCPFLQMVSIPRSVTYIDYVAFEFCTSLTSYIVDEENPVYASRNGVVYSKNGDELVLYPQGDKSSSFTVPDTVRKICAGAFEFTYSLRSLVIPESVKKIEYNAFYNAMALSDISFPDTLIKIDGSAFEDSKWYENQPDGVVYAGKIALGYKGSKPKEPFSITLKDGTLGIATYAFAGLNINAVTLPDSLIDIGDDAFEYCENLTSVTIPDSVTSIGYFAFSDCTGLTEVVLSKNLQEIGQYAFIGCENLSELLIPKTVASIGAEAFAYCDNLKLLVYENTYAKEYAIENDIPYEIVKETIPGLTFGDGFVTGFTANLTCSEFVSKYGDDLTIKDANGEEADENEYVATGFIVTFNKNEYTVVVSGDLNGDGDVDTDDTLLLKKTILGTAALEGAYLKAGCVSGSNHPTVIDFLRIKKHIMGTYNLFENNI